MPSVMCDRHINKLLLWSTILSKKILWLLSDSSIGLTHKSAIGIDFLDETVNSKNVIIYNAAKCFLFSYM